MMDAPERIEQALVGLAPFLTQLDGATPSAPPALTALWALLQRTAQRSPLANAALGVFRLEPDDVRNRKRLAGALAELLPEAELTELQTLSSRLEADLPGVQFSNSGVNSGQQVGVNSGTMIQSNVDLRNADFGGAQNVRISGVTLNQHSSVDPPEPPAETSA